MPLTILHFFVLQHSKITKGLFQRLKKITQKNSFQQDAIFRPLLNGPTDTECSLEEAISEFRNLITGDLEIGQWEELSKKAKDVSFHNIEILSKLAVKILQSTKPILNMKYHFPLCNKVFPTSLQQQRESEERN